MSDLGYEILDAKFNFKPLRGSHKKARYGSAGLLE
jgi:hypothetical protein